MKQRMNVFGQEKVDLVSLSAERISAPQSWTAPHCSAISSVIKRKTPAEYIYTTV